MITKKGKGFASEYVNELTKLKYKLRAVNIIIAMLLFTVFALIYANINTARAQKVVLVPIGLADVVEVGDSFASANLLKAYGNYVSTLLFNFNTDTVVSQYEELAKMSVASIRKDAIEQAMNYKKNSVSSRIIIQSIAVTDKKITVITKRTKYILDKPMEERTVELVIYYAIEFGNFKIVSLEDTDENIN